MISDGRCCCDRGGGGGIYPGCGVSAVALAQWLWQRPGTGWFRIPVSGDECVGLLWVVEEHCVG